MPELTQFCNYVRQHFVKISSDDDKEASRENTDVEKELTWLFNGRQLIEMFSLFDLADVVSHLIQSISIQEPLKKMDIIDLNGQRH